MDNIVIENFFNNIDGLEASIKKVPLYDIEWHQKRPKFDKNFVYPGLRSMPLHDSFRYLSEIIKERILHYLYFIPHFQKPFDITSCIHLRREQDNAGEYIHKDPYTYTGLIYLNNNENSGTNIYNEDRNNPKVTMSVKCVKNRLFLFRSDQYHSSFGNFGDNIDNGRLTINFFVK